MRGVKALANKYSIPQRVLLRLLEMGEVDEWGDLDWYISTFYWGRFESDQEFAKKYADRDQPSYMKGGPYINSWPINCVDWTKAAEELHKDAVRAIISKHYFAY